QLIHKSLSVPVQQQGSLSPHGLGDEEPSPRFPGVERGGMDLHVIQMLQPDAMLFCNVNGVACQVGKIGGVPVSPADASACQDGKWRPYGDPFLSPPCQDTRAPSHLSRIPLRTLPAS